MFGLDWCEGHFSSLSVLLCPAWPLLRQARPARHRRRIHSHFRRPSIARSPPIPPFGGTTDGPINLAGLALARERPNPEAKPRVELEKETPKRGLGLALPLELGGKRPKRIAVGQATIRAGEAETRRDRRAVRNDVRRAYYAAVVANERLNVLREQRDLSGAPATRRRRASTRETRPGSK